MHFHTQTYTDMQTHKHLYAYPHPHINVNVNIHDTHTHTHAHTHTHSVNKWKSASYKIPSKSTDKRDLGENRAIMLIFVASWKNHSGNKETGCQFPEKHLLPLN